MKLRNAAVLCLLFAAAGCGQKGPLYLPGDPNEGRIVLPEELGGPADDDAAETDGQEEQGDDDQEEPDDRDRDGTGDEQ